MKRKNTNNTTTTLTGVDFDKIRISNLKRFIDHEEYRFEKNLINPKFFNNLEIVLNCSRIYNTPIFFFKLSKNNNNYITCSYSEIFKYFNDNQNSKLFINEVVVPDIPTKLYFDIDYPITKENKLNYGEFKSIIYEIINFFYDEIIKLTGGMVMSTKDLIKENKIIILDSSRKEKFSFHIFFDPTIILFNTSYDVSLFIKEITFMMKNGTNSYLRNNKAHEFIDFQNLVDGENTTVNLRTYFSVKYECPNSKLLLLEDVDLNDNDNNVNVNTDNDNNDNVQNEKEHENTFNLEILKKSLIQYVKLSELKDHYIYKRKFKNILDYGFKIGFNTINSSNFNSISGSAVQKYEKINFNKKLFEDFIQEYKDFYKMEFGLNIDMKICRVKRQINNNPTKLLITLKNTICERYQFRVKYGLSKHKNHVGFYDSSQFLIIEKDGNYYQRCFRCDRIQPSNDKNLPKEMIDEFSNDYKIYKENIKKGIKDCKFPVWKLSHEIKNQKIKTEIQKYFNK
jgi:hypothetical protein